MKTKLGVANRGSRICVAGVGLLLVAVALGAVACGDSKSNAEPVVADAGADPEPSMGGSGGGGGAAGDDSAPDAGLPSFESPFPDIDVQLPSRGPCTAGDTRECSFDFLCSGTQTCEDDGSGFGPCDCGGAVITSGQGLVGASCDDDRDCLPGGVCFTAESDLFFGQGGPAGGYCTIGCVDSNECAEVDPLSRCVGWGPGGDPYCIRMCQSKNPEPGEDKCLNRPDLVCNSIVAGGADVFAAERQDGVCEPRCGSDSECPEGRVCHRQGGICRANPSRGLPTGSRCTLTTDCDGRECVDLDENGVGTCTALCTLGSLAGCGFARDAEERGAGCIAPLISSGPFSEGVGDFGVCQQLCDVATDCFRADEGAACGMLPPALASFFGRPGACFGP